MRSLPSELGPYRLIRLLGQGGMGAVYEARQLPLDRSVALKTLHAESARNKDAVARFFNEAKVLSRLEHPSIVQIFDFGTDSDGTSYLAMEYLRGESLAHRLRVFAERGERISIVSALQFAWQVADVLAIAHEQGVIHRDLKPDNLMLIADPVAPGGERVKVLDFGIAKLSRPDDRGIVKTNTNALMGTPMYMSPEQCAGAGSVDARADVYSLGCIIYEMLAGRPLFTAAGVGEIIGMHLFQPPPPLSKVALKIPVQIADFVHQLLIKDKTQRPSMSQVADELGRLLSKISGAGPVVRSRGTVPTDPDATRAIPIGRASSTLDQLVGQWSSRPRRRLILLAASSLGILFAALFAVLSMRSARHVGPAVAVPLQSTGPSAASPVRLSNSPSSAVRQPPAPTISPASLSEDKAAQPARPETALSKPSVLTQPRPIARTAPAMKPAKKLEPAKFNYED